jgi:pimeloyl-ACP methyl ester carboxylesterase
VALLDVNGARISYRTSGAGPVLLAPECNYTWDPAFEALMARSFTVVVASPRDFGTSSRTGSPYVPRAWADDMLAVMRHLGHDRFAVFGYSFTGAFGPWLAQELREQATITAVASGGFPLLGDYGVTSRDVDEQMARMQQDEPSWRALQERFDLRAGAAFYRELARRAPDSLVDEGTAPLYCFWGDRDHDAVEMVMPHADLAAGLDRRGVDWVMHAGFDHEQLSADLAVAWPAVERWLLARAG